jgi:hypothetical protein
MRQHPLNKSKIKCRQETRPACTLSSWIIPDDHGHTGEHQQAADNHARVDMQFAKQQPGEQRYKNRVGAIDPAWSF